MREAAESAGPMAPLPFVVRGSRRETHDCRTVELAPLDGPSPSFEPGQFNMLYAFGIGEVPISISGDPARGGSLMHTVRAVGAVSRALCAARRGEIIGVRGPFGSSWPVGEAAGSDLLIMAGGIGLAPLRPAIYRLLATRIRYGRLAVLYGARSPRDLLFRHELQGWRGRFDLQVEVSVDHAAGEPFGNIGSVTTLVGKVDFDPADTVAFVCGPEVMIRFAVQELITRGVARERIHVSLERNMKCGIGLCGHCQLGAYFLCQDGPVVPYADVARLLEIREA